MILAVAASGCGSKETDEGATGKADSAVSTEDNEEEKASGSRPPEEQLLYDYFEAIDEGRYQDAYGMWAADQRPTDFNEFAASYRDYVSAVGVSSLKRVPEFSAPGSEVFQVELDATYIKEYPAGSGEIPVFWTVVQDFENPDRWFIASSGTGP